MKKASMFLIMLVLVSLSGCILVPWDWGGDREGGEHGEHHEGRR